MSEIITVTEDVRVGDIILEAGDKIEVLTEEDLKILESEESTSKIEEDTSKVEENVSSSVEIDYPGLDGMLTVDTEEDGTCSIYGNIDFDMKGMNVANPTKAATDAVQALVKALGVKLEDQVESPFTDDAMGIDDIDTTEVDIEI